LSEASVAAITSMHLVEHLPHETLLHLLDEARRVLQSGGVLILETPNPENILVGACTFYTDPTHVRPIPPTLLQWLLKSRGFEEPAIERLTENRAVPDLSPVSSDTPGAEQINQMIEWFTAPPDYAVIARK
nr:class I SAM-dependent methyltransferase [Pseudomonadota bacterium]